MLLLGVACAEPGHHHLASTASAPVLDGEAAETLHGAPHSGDDRLGTKSSIIPEDTLQGPVCRPTIGPAPPDVRACARAVVVEKIRHGKFFNIGGLMPLYATEKISDAEIADILAYLGL